MNINLPLKCCIACLLGTAVWLPLHGGESTAESLLDEMASPRADGRQIARRIGSLSPSQFSFFIKEIDRRGGDSSEKAVGAIGFAIQALVRTAGHDAAAGLIIGMLAEADLTPRLRRELVRNIEIWTNPDDIQQLSSVVMRLGGLKWPTGNDHITPDFGISGLLDVAAGRARRSGRDADTALIVKLAAERVDAALPGLIGRATDEEAFPGIKGASTFATLSSYRSLLGEDFDKALLAAFVAENTAVPKQLAILNRMWPTEEKPSAIRRHLAALSNPPVPSGSSVLPTSTPVQVQQPVEPTSSSKPKATTASLPERKGMSLVWFTGLGLLALMIVALWRFLRK